MEGREEIERLVRGPEEWALREARGGGPFTSRVTWDLPHGGSASWNSRDGRKQGAIEVRTDSGSPLTALSAESRTARGLVRCNWVSAIGFTIGGSLFAIGALIAQVGSSGNELIASIYLLGGVFFSTGAYASVVQAINAPGKVGRSGVLTSGRWRWWDCLPLQIGWLATFVLFVGTLVFGINLVDSFIQGLTPQQENRLIWAPDLIGCIFFLVSGHLSFVEICHGWPDLRHRSSGWWIVAVNQLGSVLFLVAAIAAFAGPNTGDEINAAVANWGTFTGAACFAIGGVMQVFERPSGS